MKISFDLGKNGQHRFRGLGSKLIVVVKLAHKTLAIYKFYKIWQLQFWSTLWLLNIFIMLFNDFIAVDSWLVIGASAIYIYIYMYYLKHCRQFV